ncbi:MAG: hypothetical protein ACTS2F_06920 [Thainema sp.]
MKFLASILILLIGTGAFCWLMTADLGFGPFCHLIGFVGGMAFLGIAGVASLKAL